MRKILIATSLVFAVGAYNVIAARGSSASTAESAPGADIVRLAAPAQGKGETSFAAWSKLAAKASTSPAQATKDDRVVRWRGVDGRLISVVVRKPRDAERRATVTVAPVPAGEDAGPYFERAIAEARERGAGTLVIPKSVYHFRQKPRDQSAYVTIRGLKDLRVEGNGARLVFEQNVDGIAILGGARIVVHDLELAYGLKNSVLGVIRANGDVNELVLDEDYPGAEPLVGHIFQYDRGFVRGGIRLYLPPGDPRQPKLTATRTYRSVAFNGKDKVGKPVLLFPHWYGANALSIKESGRELAEDVTLDGVTVRSSPGYGVLVYGLKRGFHMVRSAIQPDPDALVSTEYDGVHILLSAQDLVLEDNTIEKQGDDAINLSAQVSPVVSMQGDGRRMVVSKFSRFILPGQQLAFFSAGGVFEGVATVTAITPRQGMEHEILVDRPMRSVRKITFVRNLSIGFGRAYVHGNRIGDCVCHGVLAQTPNTLIDGNMIRNTTGAALRGLAGTGFFLEGVGAINLKITNNHIVNSGYDAPAGAPWGAINVYGMGPAGVIKDGVVNHNVEISDNLIEGYMQKCVMVASTLGAQVRNNTCRQAAAPQIATAR
jgi:hypothetical protein